jgi:4a-hydroxytetrahydrobiopterin dehydratase
MTQPMIQPMAQPIGNMTKLGVSLAGAILVWLGSGSAAVLAVPSLLNATDVAVRMRDLPGWITDGQQLSCTYKFEDFVEAIAFVNRLVIPAETAQHHPDLAISYNQVTLLLTTHDAGGLTDLDFRVAESAAQLSASPGQLPRQCEPQ